MAVISYNGQPRTFRDFLAGLFRPVPAARNAETKALPISSLTTEMVASWWGGATWETPYFQNFVTNAYRQNGAVFACIQKFARAFAEPTICVYDTKTREKIERDKARGPADRLYALLEKPNSEMGEKELWLYHATWLPLGGNGYIHKVRNLGNMTAELWPYSHGKIRAVPDTSPKPQGWVSHFQYALGANKYLDLLKDDVIHVKWMPDPDRYWQGMSALEPVWREIQTDNELTRTVKALLENDAIPRTVLNLPPDVDLSDDERGKVKADWKRWFSGNKKGDVAVLSGGLTMARAALNMQELEMEALRRIPETRIAACLATPAQLVGLYAGLEKSTYNNLDEASADFTNRALMPAWEQTASELNQNLVPEFDPSGSIYLAFDTTQVAAMKEDMAEKAAWVVPAWKEGILTLNQTLKLLGEQAVTGPEGDERKSEPPPPSPTPPSPEPSSPASEPVTQEGDAYAAKALALIGMNGKGGQ